MEVYGSWFWWTLTAVAAVQTFLTALQTWENRRFSFSRLRRQEPPPESDRRARICIPCKGVDVGLYENLRPLFGQDHTNYELVFVVESLSDAAAEVIERLMLEHPHVDAQMLVAGRATESGQKVHNLRVATAEIGPDVEILAFMDSDARPSASWLRRLVARLGRDQVGATTAYRWFIPARMTPSNLILYSINSMIAGMFGPGGHHLVWGGSWAISRNVFDSIGLHEAWYGTISDDLVASRVLRRNRLRIEFEPRCLVASPLEYSTFMMAEFIRRQYVMARFCVPRLWLMALAVGILANVAFWGCVAIVAMPHRFTTATVVGAGCAVLFLYGMQALRASYRQSVGREALPEQTAKLTVARWFDVLAGPLVSLVNLIGLITSTCGSTVTWRGIRYRVFAGGQSRTLNREVRAAEIWPPAPHLPAARPLSRSTSSTEIRLRPPHARRP